jgi:hypothetical protein
MSLSEALPRYADTPVGQIRALAADGAAAIGDPVKMARAIIESATAALHQASTNSGTASPSTTTSSPPSKSLRSAVTTKLARRVHRAKAPAPSFKAGISEPN